MSSWIAPETRGRLGTGLGLAIAAVLVAVAGGVFKPAAYLNPAASAAFFPSLALLGVFVCGCLIALGFGQTDAADKVTREGLVRALATIAVIGAYALALPRVGLLVTTLALLIFAPLALEYTRWLPIAVSAVAITGLSWFVFIELMRVPLVVLW